MRTTTHKIGEISVDAGLCWVGDPCYFWPKDNGELSSVSQDIGDWREFCMKIAQSPYAIKRHTSFDGLGVVVSSALGDGNYPVYAEIDDKGLVVSMTVKFLEDKEDDNDEYEYEEQEEEE